MAKSKKQGSNSSSKKTSKSKPKAIQQLEPLQSVAAVLVTGEASEQAVNNYLQKLSNSIKLGAVYLVGDFPLTEQEQMPDTGYATYKVASLAEAVDGATADLVLVVEDMQVAARNVATWLQKQPVGPGEDSIWIASRFHKDSQLKEPLKSTALETASRVGSRLLLGVSAGDLQSSYRLYPNAAAKLLLGAGATGDGLQELYKARLYQLDVVEQATVVGTFKPQDSPNPFAAWLKSWGTWFQYYTTAPKRDAHQAYFKGKESPWFRTIFAAFALFLFLFMPYLASDYGITADEHVQNEYGKRLIRYWDDNDTDALFYKDLYNYGGLFDYFAARANEWFGGEGVDEYDVRHRLNALFGAFMMLFVGLIGRLVTRSWLGGLLAMFLLFCSPRMFGHSMNNPKDIPFAAAYVFTIYHAFQFARQLPKPSVRTVLLVILGIAASINVRIGGLLLIAYTAAFSGITFLWKPTLRVQLTNIILMGKLLLLGGFIAVAGLWLGTVYWPYGALDWTSKPFEVLGKMSNYYVGIRVLFDEQNFWSDTVPWNYIPNWMWYTTPLVVLTGFLALPLAFLAPQNKQQRLPIFLVAFAALFPICYVIYQKSGLYDAMRHLLFAYALFPVMAAISWQTLMRYKRPVAIGAAVLVLALSALPISFMWRNHPYQYTYFNELIGGNQGAFMKYESDYWMVGMKELSTWFDENIAAQNNRQDTLILATNCFYPVSHYFKNTNVDARYVRYHDREKSTWDYGLFYSRFINRKFLKNGAWPPGEILHQIEVDGVPIGMVVKRKSDPKAAGGRAFARKDWVGTIQAFEKVVKENPKNESAYLLLAQAYTQTRQWPEMKVVLDSLMALSDEYSNTLGMLGVYYMNTGKREEAIEAFEKAVEVNYKYTYGNFQLAQLYSQEKRYAEAMERLEQFDAYGGRPIQGYDLAIQISQATRNDLQYSFFKAKKLSIQKKWKEALPLLNNALAIDPTYEPAVKMKRSYDDAVGLQKLQAELKKNKK